MELAQLARMSFAASDLTATGSHLFTNSTYGHVYGSWQNCCFTTNFIPFAGDIESTVTGDGIVITNVSGRAFVLGYDAWTNGNGGSLAVWIDGRFNTLINANTPTNYYNTLSFGATNVIVAQVFSGLAPGSHTIALTNMGGGVVAFSFCLFPDMRQVQIPVFDMEIYTPSIPGYDNPWGISQYNAAKLSNDLALNAIGLPVHFVATAAIMPTTYLCDGLHPNYFGHVVLAQRLVGELTGDSDWFSSWLMSTAIGTTVQPYAAGLALLSENDASALTNLNASQLATGQVPIAALTNLEFWLTNTIPATQGGIFQYQDGHLQWISTNGFAPLDQTGVVLAAIQGLNQKVEQHNSLLKTQSAQLKDKDAEIENLERRLEKLEQRLNEK